MTSRVSRKKCMTERVVFVDGQPGCGKTLFSPIIASLSRVELLTFAYEIQHYCTLKYLDKLSADAAHTLIRLMTDLQLYNTMMGRDLNFRPSDLSSVLKDHDPSRYFQRMFKDGDAVIPDIIKAERPILHLTTHNLLSVSEPIWESLRERCIFIEIIRHPAYMVRQQKLNMERLNDNVRNFTINIEYNEQEIPYYTYGWEDIFLNANPIEKAIHCIVKNTLHTEKTKKLMKEKYDATIITIPFEQFVLNPEPWVDQIADKLASEITDSTRNVMCQQNVPRQKIAQGIDLEIYKRCGWVPPIEGASEREELLIRREDFSNEADGDVMLIFDQLCNEYESTYWNPDCVE